MFILLCVCFLDLAAKQMKKPCPVLMGDGLALRNGLSTLHPGVGCDVSFWCWPGLSWCC